MNINKVIKYHEKKLHFQNQKLVDLETFYKSKQYQKLGRNEKATLEETMNKCRSEIQFLKITISHLKVVKE
ncbi:MAG: hypothetical protein ACFFG0_50395 [Candidatus Thorarchaeota archaeon]